jgi:hypothetical protein
MIKIAPNGQWTLAKSDEGSGPPPTTLHGRPKKLGFQTVDKKSVLGEHPDDLYNKVQYAKLAKKLRVIQELLKKA